MLDLDQVDMARIVARGKYATVRAAREDACKALQAACTAMSSLMHPIMKAAQDGSYPDADLRAMESVRNDIEVLSHRVQSLTDQKNSLYAEAWK